MLLLSAGLTSKVPLIVVQASLRGLNLHSLGCYTLSFHSSDFPKNNQHTSTWTTDRPLIFWRIALNFTHGPNTSTSATILLPRMSRVAWSKLSGANRFNGGWYVYKAPSERKICTVHWRYWHGHSLRGSVVKSVSGIYTSHLSIM